MPAQECTTNKECIDAHGGTPYLCRKTDGRCVAPTLYGCEPHAEAGDFANDDAIWFGVLLPTKDDVLGLQALRAVELGRRDFAQMTGGIPSNDPAKPRPLAFVACDDSADASAKAVYLAEDLRVPGVIGFAKSREVIDLATRVFIPHKVVSVVGIGASSLITSIAHPPGSPRLVWRTTTSSVTMAPAVAAIVRDIDEPASRCAAWPRGEQVRVALLRRGTAAGLGFASVLVPILRFNGRPAIDNDTDFAEISFGDPSGAEGHAEYARAVKDLLGFRPDIVVLQGGSEVGPEILEPVEREWPARTPRPFYIASSGIGTRATSPFLITSPLGDGECSASASIGRPSPILS